MWFTFASVCGGLSVLLSVVADGKCVIGVDIVYVQVVETKNCLPLVASCCNNLKNHDG